MSWKLCSSCRFFKNLKREPKSTDSFEEFISSTPKKIEEQPKPTFRIIPLSHSQKSIVEIEDYETYSRFEWRATWSPAMKSYYACRTEKDEKGKNQIVFLHREILGLKPGDKRQGDHALHNTLDNRRFVDGKENLRIATAAENRRNSLKRRDNLSGFKGVSQVSQDCYQALICVNYQRISLGYRTTAEAAHRELYVPAAKYLHGRFAHLGTDDLQVLFNAGVYGIELEKLIKTKELKNNQFHA